MTNKVDRRVDTTRRQILRAAAHQFARRPYHDVGLDGILADAKLTKGAMYFHFRSKQALALAVVEDHLTVAHEAVRELVDRRLAGMETIIDVCYLMVVEDIRSDASRAVLQLLPVVGRSEGLRDRLLAEWIHILTVLAERAIAEGDLIDHCDPRDVASMLISLYLGLRQTSDLDTPEEFLRQAEKMWAMVLPAIVVPERIGYFTQFIRRRSALATKTTSTGVDSAGPNGGRGH